MATQTIFNWSGSTSYTLTDGQITGPNLATSGVTVQGNTSLNLISQNAPDYTVPLNSNFIWLLQNFAGSAQPANAVSGQLWYDTGTPSNPLLKVYNSSAAAFQTITGIAASVSGSNIGLVQFNNGSGQLAADTDFRWFTANNTLSVENLSVNNTASFITQVNVGNPASPNAFVSIDSAGDLTVGNSATFLGNVTIGTEIQANTLTLLGIANLDSNLNLTGYANLAGNVKAKGSNGQLQINSGGNLAGSSNLTYSSGTFNITGIANVSGNLIVGGNIVGTVSNISGIETFTAVTVTANIVTTTTAPGSNTANGTAGQIAFDANNIYVCVSSNTWKRAALSTFS